jgi:hypothetical protein
MAKIKAATDSIKQQLSKAMYNVVGQMKNNRDSVGFQVANLISQRMGKMIDSLPWKRGEGKFDRNTHFGQANNMGGMGSPESQNDGGGTNPAMPSTGEMWQQKMSTPEGQQRVAQHYAKKLGVNTDMIMKLIQNGMTNPALWKGMIDTFKNGGGRYNPHAAAANNQQAPQPMPQDMNPEYKQALARMAARPRMGSAAGRVAMNKF